MGRKSRYETHVKPFLGEISKWYEDLTEEEIATKKLGVAVSTFEKYKKEHPELKQALLDGRQNLVIDLKASLKRKAKGFYYTETKTVKVHDFENDIDVIAKVETYKKYAQPDTGAAHLLLKNLDPSWHNDDAETLEIKKKQVELQKQKLDQDNW